MQIQKNSGFTLLEVLVALLIFAIGMLGLAGLQLIGHQSSSFAHGRTTATLAASGLSERMRSNLNGVNAGDYAFSDTNLPAADADCNTTTGCLNAANQAANDIREWLLALNQSLPILNSAQSAVDNDSHIEICIDSTPTTAAPTNPGDNIDCDGLANQWTIYVDWTDNRNVNASVINRYTLTFTP